MNRNKEIQRFVDYVGGPTKASKILGCTPNMVHKMTSGVRGFKPRHVRAMHHTRGFNLSFEELFELNGPK